MRFSNEDYAELLALYLGDGTISSGPRSSRLRIVLDAKYPQIIERTRALLVRCFPRNAVDVVRRKRQDCVDVSVYSTHLVCLFPQHGPGVKHKRAIVLEPWQAQVVNTAPWAFLRGCINSDGSVFVNRTGAYEYLSYDFSNKSGDIASLFVAVCEGLGVKPRINLDPRGVWKVRINRRECVARMLEHVPVKS